MEARGGDYTIKERGDEISAGLGWRHLGYCDSWCAGGSKGWTKFTPMMSVASKGKGETVVILASISVEGGIRRRPPLVFTVQKSVRKTNYTHDDPVMKVLVC